MSGSEITFEGTSTTVGSTTVYVSGDAQPVAGGYQVHMRLITTTGMGAVVDNENFAQANGVATESTLLATT